MTIHEPATLITDYMLAAFGAVCGWRLLRSAGAVNLSRRWWSRALWCSGFGAWIGGSYHGFGPMLSSAWSDALWSTTLVVLCLTSAAMAMALVHDIAPAAHRRRWQWLVWAKFAGFAVLALAQPVFLVAIVDYGAVMLALAAAALFVRRGWRAPMLAAVALSALAAAVQQLGWGFSAGFNHNDLYHVIQGGAVFLFYRAGLKLGVAPREGFAP